MSSDETETPRPGRYPTLDALQGAAGSLARPLSWAEMREIARENLVNAYRPKAEQDHRRAHRAARGAEGDGSIR